MNILWGLVVASYQIIMLNIFFYEFISIANDRLVISNVKVQTFRPKMIDKSLESDWRLCKVDKGLSLKVRIDKSVDLIETNDENVENERLFPMSKSG